jgi:uncharacterized protein
LLLLWIVMVGLVAGFVDAIAGGGGLIMLPGLIFAGLPVSSAIATNKLCGTAGAIASTLKFAQSKQIDWRACLTMGIPAVVGAYLGSRSIGLLPTTWAEPIVIVLMVAITLFVVFRPNFGMENKTETAEATAEATDEISSANAHPTLSFRRSIASLIAGALIGFHDGFFGPGTGIFLVFALLSIRSLDFLRGTGTTKVINLMTNLTALVTFATSGNINYAIGLYGAVGVGLGSLFGATFATQKGAKLIKPIFIAVTTTLVIKLLLDYFTQ